MTNNTKKRRHENDERIVKCPVEGCESEPLARGVHLHVMRSEGNGHGPQGDVPPDVDFDNLETVGEQKVAMKYPVKREVEDVARLCPYCEKPFRGGHGVIIHLSQVKGKDDHPADADELHDADDFPIAHVDEAGNIIEVVDPEEGDPVMPSTQKRRENDQLEQLAQLIVDGKHEEAEEFAAQILD